MILPQSKFFLLNTFKKPILKKVKKRLLILCPAVEAGLVGKGGFGSIWKVNHKITKQIFIIKVINKDYIVKQNMVKHTNIQTEIMHKLENLYLHII